MLDVIDDKPMCNFYSGQRKHAGDGVLPTVRGKQLSDGRYPLNPGEHEEAECEFFNSGSIQFELTSSNNVSEMHVRGQTRVAITLKTTLLCDK